MSKKLASKPFVILLCIFAWISLLFHSCKKDLLLPQAPSETLLAKTKLFYNKQLLSLDLKARQLQGTSAQNNTTSLRKKPSPIWEDALVEKTPDGKTLVTVPFAKFKIDNKNLDYTRKFTFSESDGEIVDGQIVEVYGSPEVIANRGADLIGQTGGQEVAGFTGAILSYSLDYRYKQGKYYQDGHARKGSAYIDTKLPDTAAQHLQAPVSAVQKSQLSNKTLAFKPSKTIASTRPVMEDGQNCEDYYWVYMEKDNWGNVVYMEVLGYAYSICTPSQDPTQPGGFIDYYIDCAGVINGSAYNADCGCIGGTTGIASCADIIDKIKNGCLDSVWVKINGNLDSKIVNILNNTFGTSDKINFKIVDGNIDGGYSARTQVETDRIVNGIHIFDVKVTLNKNTLPFTSQEFIATTMIHEIMHAYFDSNKTYYTQQFEQHRNMAEAYMLDMKSAIQAIYSSLSDKEAYALILNGFGDIFKNDLTYWNNLLTEYDLDNQQIINIRDSYKSHTSGTLTACSQ